MRFFFPLFLLLGWCVSCGPDRHTVRLEGQLKGIDQAVIMVYADDALGSEGGAADSIKVNRGKFQHDRRIETPQLLTLVYPNYSTTTIIAEPGKTIQIKGDANRLKEIEVSGTPDNELLTNFRQRSLKNAASNINMEAASFIRSNPKTLAAIALFRLHFDAVEKRNVQPALGLLETLRKAQPNSELLRSIDQRLRPQLLTSKGGKLPKLQAKTLTGENISSQTLKGKPTLILFYANWDGEYYTMRNELRKLRKAYGNRLNTLLVCFDGQRQEAEKNAERDTLKQVVYAQGSLLSPLVQQLGVRYIPGGLLVNEKGVIVARDLPSDQWMEEIKKLQP